jgi:hypothetical protein
MSAEHDPLQLAPAVDLADRQGDSSRDNHHVNSAQATDDATRATGGVQSSPTADTARSHPRLEHTRTAPTTFPVHPVAHQPQAAAGAAGKRGGSEHDSDESPTPTLSSQVPLAAGGLHGEPMPGSHAREGVLDEKDHQAAASGGRSGPGVAALAKKELGLDAHGEKDTFDEKQTHGPPSPSATKRLERTISGTPVPRRAYTTGGSDTVTGVGMVPITRMTSQPPAVGLFGGVAPSGIDAEEGLRPVRSNEEEEERELARLAKGHDPWAVKFEPGERSNPKVRR